MVCVCVCVIGMDLYYTGYVQCVWVAVYVILLLMQFTKIDKVKKKIIKKLCTYMWFVP